jgi:hypothetical protein
MKTETFKGKDKQDLDKKIWDWKLTHGRFVVKKTHPMENLPIDLNRPKGRWTQRVLFRRINMRLKLRTQSLVFR